MRPARLVLLAVGCGALSLVTGCLSRPDPVPIRFYRLLPMEGRTAPRSQGAPVVGLVPERLPGYLEREGIVRRLEGNELSVSELHRWAEPLSDGIYGVLQQDLMLLVPEVAVVRLPVRAGTTPDLELRVRILSLDALADGEVRLDALVTLLRVEPSELLVRRVVRVRDAARGRSHAEVVAAMNRALAQLSREIAAELERAAHHGAPAGAKADLFGVGFGWDHPSDDALDSQYTGEIFCRFQLTENLALTPDLQVILDPALNPTEDVRVVPGFRVRVTF